jgi:hypothetical protein
MAIDIRYGFEKGREQSFDAPVGSMVNNAVLKALGLENPESDIFPVLEEDAVFHFLEDELVGLVGIQTELERKLMARKSDDRSLGRRQRSIRKSHPVSAYPVRKGRGALLPWRREIISSPIDITIVGSFRLHEILMPEKFYLLRGNPTEARNMELPSYR